MLKRKLVKAGLLCMTLFVIVAVKRAKGSQQTDSIPQSDSTAYLLRFDSFLLKLNGQIDPAIDSVPVIALNKHAVKFVNDYVARNGSMLEKLREQNPRSFRIMDSIFAQHGLPQELKYLAIIESKLKPRVVSPVGARGAWQLMPATARIYSLKVTAKYDERNNFYKSTVAAAKMLKYLHNQFGDWLLVVAAYNSGPGRVYQAIKKSGSRNFWKLQSFLPAETRAHVKKFIGTHYYYEQKGSVVTLTKEEVNVYRKKMTDFVEKQNKLRMLAETSADPVKENKIAQATGISEAKLNEQQ